MTQNSTQTGMSAGEWAMLVALSVIWGGSFFFNGVALGEVPVLSVVGCRVALAALALICVLKVRGDTLPRGFVIYRAFLVMGLLNNVIPFTLIVTSQQYIASGVASILNASTPLFAVVLSHVFSADEKMTPAKLIGVLIGLAGVTAMVGTDLLLDSGAHAGAYLLCVAAAVSYALSGLYGRRFRGLGVSPLATATGQLLASSLVLVPLMLAVDRPWTLPVPGAAAIAAVIAIALVSTAFAYVLFFRILSTAGPTNLSLVTFLIPPSAILLGVAFLGESLQPKHVIGMVLIGLGLAAIDGRPWRAVKAGFNRRAEGV